MTAFYTYLHCRPDGTPFYVGKGSGRRAYDFINGRNQHHKNIVAKHGRENVGVFVFPCESEEQAFADEVQQIAQLREYGLANHSTGGEGATGVRRSAETRALMSRPMSAETKAKIAAAKRGRKRPDLVGRNVLAPRTGWRHTPETREKIRIAALARWAAV